MAKTVLMHMCRCGLTILCDGRQETAEKGICHECPRCGFLVPCCRREKR